MLTLRNGLSDMLTCRLLADAMETRGDGTSRKDSLAYTGAGYELIDSASRARHDSTSSSVSTAKTTRKLVTTVHLQNYSTMSGSASAPVIGIIGMGDVSEGSGYIMADCRWVACMPADFRRADTRRKSAGSELATAALPS